MVFKMQFDVKIVILIICNGKSRERRRNEKIDVVGQCFRSNDGWLELSGPKLTGSPTRGRARTGCGTSAAATRFCGCLGTTSNSSVIPVHTPVSPAPGPGIQRRRAMYLYCVHAMLQLQGFSLLKGRVWGSDWELAVGGRTDHFFFQGERATEGYPGDEILNT